MKNFISTQKLKKDFSLRVHKKGYGYGLLSIANVNEYFIAAMCPYDLYRNINEGDILDAYLWMEKVASYEFSLKTIGKISTPPMLVFSHTNEINVSKERKCLKARVNIPVTFFPIQLNKTEKSFHTEDVVLHKGKIVELGDRDAVLEYDTRISDELLIKGHLPINSDSIDFTAKIVACSTDKGKHHLNLEYIGMSDKERSRILDFVFTVYRE